MELEDAIGWAASIILILTVSRQAWLQSQNRQGVSQWLFIGQMLASFGFLIYSWLLDNVIFTVSNAVLLVTALLGQYFYLRNKQQERIEGN